MVKRGKDAGSEVCERHTSDRGRSIAPASSPLGAETYAEVRTLRPQVDDLPEVKPDRPLVAVDLVPAVLAERLQQRLQLPVVYAQREHLSALEADADLLLVAGRRHQCAPTAAGSTISVSTPAGEGGGTKATREPRIPLRGCSSIRARPACFSASSAPSMSSTW